jgi:hypothetical protein
MIRVMLGVLLAYHCHESADLLTLCIQRSFSMRTVSCWRGSSWMEERAYFRVVYADRDSG